MLFRSNAVTAPKIPPGNVIAANFMLLPNSEYLSDLKDAMADKLWTTIATRFVPFAVAESSPRKINNGNVNAEPPPAVTFKKPDANPAIKSSKVWIRSISIGNIILYSGNFQ